MVQTRMPEIFGFDDLIRNFMVVIEPKAQSHNNFRILEMSKIFQFFCNIAELRYSRITILPVSSGVEKLECIAIYHIVSVEGK
jgi:hypothetical protein